MSDIHCVYYYPDPLTFIPRYVGRTNNVEIRDKAHKMSYTDAKEKTLWFQTQVQRGHAPSMRLLAENLAMDEAQWMEAFWIQYLLWKGVPLLNKQMHYVPREKLEWVLLQVRLDEVEEVKAHKQVATCILHGHYAEIDLRAIASFELKRMFQDDIDILFQHLTGYSYP